jgi:hypothetical protein
VLASDVLGNTLTYQLSGQPGTLTMDTATGLISGYISYRNVSASEGTKTFRVTVSVTGGGATDYRAFDWTIEDMDWFSQSLVAENREGEWVTLELPATDAEGNQVTYICAEGMPIGITFDAAAGRLSGGISYANADGETPLRDYPVAVTYEVAGSTETRSLVWRIHNVKRIAEIGDQEHTEGAFVDLYLGPIKDSFGNILTYFVNGAPHGLSLVYGEDPELPSGGGVYLTGIVLSDNAARDPGVAHLNVSITVSDSANPSATDSLSFSWTVLDRPVLNNLADRISAEGDIVHVDILDDNIIWATGAIIVEGLPPGLDFIPESGKISGWIRYEAVQTEEVKTFQVTVTVGEGVSQETGSFLWTVMDRPEAPVASDDYLEVRWTKTQDGNWALYLSEEQVADGWTSIIDDIGQLWLRIPPETGILRNDYIPSSTPTTVQPEQGADMYDTSGRIVGRFEQGPAGGYTGAILVRIPAQPGESFTASYMLVTPVQSAAAALLVSHVPIQPVVQQYENTGHHFFPLQLVRKYDKYLADEAKQIAHAMTSGDIGVHNGSPVNGITHAKYTEAVDKEFNKYLTRWFRENKGKTKLDAEGMQKFIMNLIEGKGADGIVNKTIQRYNQGILARCRLPEADRPYKVVLKATAREEKMTIVREIVKQKPWKRRMAIINSVLAVQVMGITTEVAAKQVNGVVEALGDEQFQQWFQQAMDALQNGQLEIARLYLIDDNNSCKQVLQDKLGAAGLGLVQKFETKISELFEKYEKMRNNNWTNTGYDWIAP